MERMDETSELCDELFILLSSSMADIRLGAMRLLAKNNNSRFFGKLMNILNTNTSIDLNEAEEIGKILAVVNPEECERAFTDWVAPKSLFNLKRVTVRKNPSGPPLPPSVPVLVNTMSSSSMH